MSNLHEEEEEIFQPPITDDDFMHAIYVKEEDKENLMNKFKEFQIEK